MKLSDLTTRAFAAWFRAGGQDQPSAASSGVEEIDGKSYVVLRNACGVLAVYRVKTDGFLKRLVRWPEQLEK